MWRFGREVKTLWRIVVCSKYGLDEAYLFWSIKDIKKASFFMKSIESLLKDGSLTAKVINGGFTVVIGNGEMVNFWSKIKVDDRRLKEAFLRCHVLAVVKNENIQNFGHWEGLNWVWRILTRYR
ncbi:hypothetical protein Ddye_000930 [Dipteronia dyeriana]|uniref:Uncharacterized protein n=1 Tax=Dipteronia dyeriana TaxID=168575 RepID=A0AAD9XMI7_9ROSI|nr:hypothetical protein Ddye_000930 [Dipteronia dyeriana]